MSENNNMKAIGDEELLEVTGGANTVTQGNRKPNPSASHIRKLSERPKGNNSMPQVTVKCQYCPAEFIMSMGEPSHVCPVCGKTNHYAG